MARKHAVELGLIERSLSRFPGLTLALVFGSVARGTARADSDLDLAVAGTNPDVLAIAAALAEELGREVDVVRLKDASLAESAGSVSAR